MTLVNGISINNAIVNKRATTYRFIELGEENNVNSLLTQDSEDVGWNAYKQDVLVLMCIHMLLTFISIEAF